MNNRPILYLYQNKSLNLWTLCQTVPSSSNMRSRYIFRKKSVQQSRSWI